jgi:hypothetical protein
LSLGESPEVVERQGDSHWIPQLLTDPAALLKERLCE